MEGGGAGRGGGRFRFAGCLWVEQKNRMRIGNKKEKEYRGRREKEVKVGLVNRRG